MFDVPLCLVELDIRFKDVYALDVVALACPVMLTIGNDSQECHSEDGGTTR